MCYKGIAKVKFYSRYCAAYTCKDFANYYRSLLPKAWYVKPQKYPPHITVVRLSKEEADTGHKNWGICDGKEVEFEYEPIVRSDGKYYWLDCWSEDIGSIRTSLGLRPYREGFDRYHLTIGNSK